MKSGEGTELGGLRKYHLQTEYPQYSTVPAICHIVGVFEREKEGLRE